MRLSSRTIHFSKYQGAGNDFIIINDFEGPTLLTQDQVNQLCDRRFGIGADGMILIRPSEQADYEMVYYNADGNIGSMCGNGARCAFAFMKKHGHESPIATFLAFDGIHIAKALPGDWVEISMNDIDGLNYQNEDCILDTGSPHYVRFVDDLKLVDVVKEGRQIRNTPPFEAEGINVNFVEIRPNLLRLSTYERGVENRTLACGTGATAVALAYAARENLSEGPVSITADGGNLAVNFTYTNGNFENVVLQGPAEEVFTGEFNPKDY